MLFGMFLGENMNEDNTKRAKEGIIKNENEEGDIDEKKERNLKDFKKAGKIAYDIIKESKSMIIPGQSLLDIAESIEKLIVDKSGSPAFPCTVSVNNIAAHDAPEYKDDRLLGEKDIVKVDFGVHINGCVSDNAYTIDLSGENGKLVEASEKALENAISSIKPGKKTGEIGKAIEDTITKYGFKPIENLSGHMILPYILHAGPTIPNIASQGGYTIQEGDVFAIEPFVTERDGAGKVKDDHAFMEIFSLEDVKNVRSPKARQIITNIFQERFTLPFCRRWLYNRFGFSITVGAALREMMAKEIIAGYPRLLEVNKGIISQTERTVIVEKDGAVVLE